MAYLARVSAGAEAPTADAIQWDGSYTARSAITTTMPGGRVTHDATIEAVGGLKRIELETGQVMVDTGEWVVALDADGRQEVLCPSYEDLSQDDLGPGYRVAYADGGAVADRPTQLMTVRDARTDRVALQLWRDAETGVPLARQSYLHDGQLASRAQILSIDYSAEPSPIDPVELPGRSVAGELMSAEKFARRASFTPVEPGYLPEGYRAEGLFCHDCDRGRAYAEYRYTDGLRILSVYQRHPRGEQGGRGRGRGPGRGRGMGPGAESHIGRIQTLDLGLARAARQRRGDMVVIVVGDLPVEDAERVLRSVPQREAD